jgi:hypothetical protein
MHSERIKGERKANPFHATIMVNEKYEMGTGWSGKLGRGERLQQNHPYEEYVSSD